MRFSRSNTFYGEPVADVTGWADVINQNVGAGHLVGADPAVFMWLSPEDNTWWYVEVTLDDYRAVNPEPMDVVEPTNTHGLTDNCYYCTVAALRGVTVDQLITETELMQYAGGASVDELNELLQASGMSTASTEYGSYPDLQAGILTSANGSDRRFALGFARPDGSGHAVVAATEQGTITFRDYQSGDGDDATADVSGGSAFLLYPQ